MLETSLQGKPGHMKITLEWWSKQAITKGKREAIRRQDGFKLCRKQKMDEILIQIGATGP